MKEFIQNVIKTHLLIKSLQNSQITKNIDVYYKVPYFDAIKEYSGNWSNAVYKTDYKDIDSIQQNDPVFNVQLQDTDNSPKGKRNSLRKDQKSKIISDNGKNDINKQEKLFDKIDQKDENIIVDLEFDGNFEWGNLHSAIKISDKEYHLFIHPDTNTGGHTQWFYFKVLNMVKNSVYTFRIMNFNK